MKIRFLILAALAPLAVAQNISTVVGASAGLKGPSGVVVDAAGTLYVSDTLSFSIKKVVGTTVTTLASGFSYPIGIALDANGNIYVADRESNKVKKVSSSGTVADFAGIGTKNNNYAEGQPALTAELNTPSGVYADSGGNIYICDTGHHLVRRVNASGIINTIAGTGVKGLTDGAALSAQFYQPYGSAMDGSGNLYIADYYNHRIRKVSGGTVSTIAGSGNSYPFPGGYSGDDGPAAQARLNGPTAVTVDKAGNVYFADTLNSCIRKINSTGTISRVAGSCTASGASGDGGPALSALLSSPTGVLIDPNGDLLFADSGNNSIRKVSLSGSGSSKPAIRSGNGVLQAFSGSNGVSSGTWLEIYGANFTNVTKTWAGSDFTGTRGPTTLGGVTVNVNAKPAFIDYVSPTQVNIQAPDDPSVGPVQIQVIGPGGTSDPVTVQKAAVSPALLTTPAFNVGGKQYIVALFPDFATYVGRTGLIAGVPFRPAKPGDTVILFAVGCGATNPVSAAGTYYSDARQIASPYTVRVGGATATATGFLAASSVGLCQFNVTVPNLDAIDATVDVTVGGVSTGQTLYLTVQP